METIRGRIEGLAAQDGIGKNGQPFKRYVFTINGKKYSTFDEKIGSDFHVGDFIEMDGEKKDLYWNMKTMKKISEPAQSSSIPARTAPADSSMIRMSAIKAASLIYEGTGKEAEFMALTEACINFLEKGEWGQNDNTQVSDSSNKI